MAILRRILLNCCRASRLGLSQCITPRRGLTSTETATALRPFIFAVHPDLFGQLPEQRNVNEDSLKKLNEYIDGLHSQRRMVPTHLTFYVRETNSSKAAKVEGTRTVVPKNIREVRIALLSACPKETVKAVLRSCNLSLDYVDSVTPIGQSRPQQFPRPVRWDSSFYEACGIPNPYTQVVKKRRDVFLDEWLSKNVTHARSRQQALVPIRQQITRLKVRLCKEAGVRQVTWDSHWGLVQYRACLCAFLRLYERHPAHINLKGHTLVFGNETGVDLNGNIILSSDDVPDSWLKFLKSMQQQHDVLGLIPDAEHQLSTLLNDIRVVRCTQHQTVLGHSYLTHVNKLAWAVRKYWMDNPHAGFDQSLSDIELVVEDGMGGSLNVSPEGQILIPHSCPGFLVLDFILKNAHVARQRQADYARKLHEELELVGQVVEELELRSLSRDENVTSEQLRHCCRHLLRDPRNLGVTSLRDCQLRVTYFYSVMSGGEVCLPWNWKGAFD